MSFSKTGKSKGGKQQYRIDVYYINPEGVKKRKTKCVYGLPETKAAEKELYAELIESSKVHKQTLQELYDEYILAKENDVRESSLQKTKSILKNHLLNTSIIKKQIDELSKKDFQEWRTVIKQKNMKITTKNNAYREFNTLLNYAVKMGYLEKNLLKELGKFKDPDLTVAVKKVRYYTPDQFRAYIAAAESCRKTFLDYCCCVFFYIAFYTGMRKGEIHALKWSDIEGKTIHITRSLSQKTKNPDGSYKEGAPKNETSIRDIQIPQKLVKILNDHKELMERSYGVDVENLRVTGGIKPISDTTLENRNTKYAELANLPHRTIHEFRHSHASVLCNHNINIMEVARRLGHKDPEITWKVYAHLYPQAEEMAISILESA